MTKTISIFRAIICSLLLLQSCTGNKINHLDEARKAVLVNQSEKFYNDKAWDYVKKEGEGS